MTGCMNSNAALPDRELDADVGRLASAVEELLQRITKIEPTVSNLDGSGMKLTLSVSRRFQTRHSRRPQSVLRDGRWQPI
jgi:hypothetical protein